jgi:hypothetical protein
VLIQAGESPPYVMPQLELASASQKIVVTYDTLTAHSPKLSVDYHTVTLARALATEIDLGYDPLYKQALTCVADMVEALP